MRKLKPQVAKVSTVATVMCDKENFHFLITLIFNKTQFTGM